MSWGLRVSWARSLPPAFGGRHVLTGGPISRLLSECHECREYGCGRAGPVAVQSVPIKESYPAIWRAGPNLISLWDKPKPMVFSARHRMLRSIYPAICLLSGGDTKSELAYLISCSGRRGYICGFSCLLSRQLPLIESSLASERRASVTLRART